jgi:hypothetical protein
MQLSKPMELGASGPGKVTRRRRMEEYNDDAVDVGPGVGPKGPFQEHTTKKLAAMNREGKKRKRCGEAAPPVSERSRGSATAKGPSKGEIGRVIRAAVSEQLERDPDLVGSKGWSDPTMEQFKMGSYLDPKLNQRLNAVTDAADAVAGALLTTAHRTLIDAAFVPDIPELLLLQSYDAKEDMRRITRIIEEAAETAFAVTIHNGMYHRAFVNAVVERLRAGQVLAPAMDI